MAIKPAVPMREQPAEIRKKNFAEVALGYNESEAQEEAARCLQCKNKPCVSGCPVNISIPEFILAIREKAYQKAIDIIHETDYLPCMTGRVCPQEDQCQLKCVLNKSGNPISIGRLERFVADWEIARRASPSHPGPQGGPPLSPSLRERERGEGGERVRQRISIVGSGPAGLSCAAELAKAGYPVTVFEGFHELGGVLVYGIPEFRLPKAIVSKEIDSLKNLGVEFVTNALIGRALTIQELFAQGYSSIFIGAGAGLPNFMNIPGENLNGVYSANEFLTRVNLMKAYKFPEYDTPVKIGKNVAVIGGGNVAMDSARTALRLGAKSVKLIYRRTEVEMPARIEEVHHAKEEGIEFVILAAPTKYLGDEQGFVRQAECIKMELGEPDASGRRSPKPIKASEYLIDCDQVIVAIGTTPNPILARTTPELKITKHGQIVVDENSMTSIPGVFAGGDIVTGAATVVTAMGAGRQAAQAISKYLEFK